MKVPVLDHGYVRLIDSMGDDLAIVNAARTSYDAASTELTDRDKGLIGFLMRERHGTPFEMVNLKFEVMAPIFVFREWHRHRIASINEMSGRYVQLERKFYVPAASDIRKQVGKPGAYEYQTVDPQLAAEVRMGIETASDFAFEEYQMMLDAGIAKEVARLVLPVNTYSKMVWSCNLRALFNFLSLRNAPSAQLEIRRYAEVIETMIHDVAPVALHYFIIHGRKAP